MYPASHYIVAVQLQLTTVHPILAIMMGYVKTSRIHFLAGVLHNSLVEHVTQVSYCIYVSGYDFSDFLWICNKILFHSGVPSPIAPRIVESPQDTSGTLSSNVTLTCVAVGNPKPEIIWYRNGNRIPSSDPEHLMIRLTLENRGFYYCMAQNSEGETRTNNVLVSIEGLFHF